MKPADRTNLAMAHAAAVGTVLSSMTLLLALLGGCTPDDGASTGTTDDTAVLVTILAHGYPSTIFVDHDGYTSSIVAGQTYYYKKVDGVHVNNTPLRTERAGCRIDINGFTVASDWPVSLGDRARCEWTNPHSSK